MENRFFIFLLNVRAPLFAVLVLVATCGISYAADEDATVSQEDAFGEVVEQNVERRQIDEAAIDSEDFEVTFYGGIISIEDFGIGTLVGARVAYHLTEHLFFEAAVGLSEAEESSFERLGGNVQLLTGDQRDFNFYNLSFGYNFLGETFLGEDYAFNTAVYAIGGIGSTDFAGQSEFTVNVGAGYRFLLNDAFAVHADVRDHIMDVTILGESKTTHNIELSLGLSIFF